jgi:MFS family permease
MVIISASIMGFSVGMNGPTLMAWAVDLCKPEHRGRAVASVYIALELGIGSGAIISGWIYQNKLENIANTHSWCRAFLRCSRCSCFLNWRKKEKRHRMRTTEAFMM